jgi:hypothetical protein
METHIYNIDSRYRDTSIYSLNSEFEYDFSTTQNGKIKNVVEINISSIELPNVSKFFNSIHGNTTLIIDNITYTIDDGNYNSSDILSVINELIPATIEFTVDTNTGKVTITTTDTHVFNFINDTDYPSLGETLGFTDLFFSIESSTKESTNIPNVIGENYYFLKINDYGNIINNDNKYMSKIVLLNPKYEMTFDSRSKFVTKSHKFKQPVDINKINIQLVDYLNNHVHLHGVQFSFTIEFKVINNKILKKYHELSFHSGELLELMLNDHMLEYYNRENNNNAFKTGETLLNNMHTLTVNEQNKISGKF